MAPIAILDVDGTLVDTNYHHAIAWYRAVARRRTRWSTTSTCSTRATYDCEAAVRADVETIAVLTGGFSSEELREAGAGAVYESLEPLLERSDDTPFARHRQG